MPEVRPFLDHVRAHFFGKLFTEEEANEALDYLGEFGLANSISVA